MNMSLKSILCHVSQSDMKVKVVMNQGLFIPCVFIFCRTSDKMIIAGNLDLGNKEQGTKGYLPPSIVARPF